MEWAGCTTDLDLAIPLSEATHESCVILTLRESQPSESEGCVDGRTEAWMGGGGWTDCGNQSHYLDKALRDNGNLRCWDGSRNPSPSNTPAIDHPAASLQPVVAEKGMAFGRKGMVAAKVLGSAACMVQTQVGHTAVDRRKAVRQRGAEE